MAYNLSMARANSQEHKTARMELRMVLTARNRDAFLAAVKKPPAPTEQLLKALRRREGLGR